MWNTGDRNGTTHCLQTWEGFLSYCLWPPGGFLCFPPVGRELAGLGKTCCPRLSPRTLHTGFYPQGEAQYQSAEPVPEQMPSDWEQGGPGVRGVESCSRGAQEAVGRICQE